MPLQNRVTPFGEIVAVAGRGLLTGNRGIIHDPATRTLLKRRWTTRAWICCRCDFRGRRRAVMATRSWTELFFLDEATALAAGHRPCFFCRREEAELFRTAFSGGKRLSAPEIDALLDAERRAGHEKRLHPFSGDWRRLPDGSMVGLGERAWLISDGRVYPWSADGYGTAKHTLPDGTMLLTPPAIVGALSAGYRPILHPSANV
jgi:hypothetical protein